MAITIATIEQNTDTKFIVEGRFEEPTFTDKDKTFADVMESIFSNEFIDLFCEIKKAKIRKDQS